MKLSNLKVLDDKEIIKVHEATLKILSETGIYFESEEALKIFAEAGANVDFNKKLVRINESLLNASLKYVPNKISFYDTRNKELAFTIGDGRIHAINDGHEIFLYDYQKAERKNITRKDIVELIKIADALPNIDMMISPGHPQDVPAKTTMLHAVDAVFSNTHKPLFFSTEGKSIMCAVIEIAKVVSGKNDLSKEPILLCEFSPTSPLNWGKDALEALMESVKEGIPSSILSMPLSGISAPYSLSGQLVVCNSEVLSGIVLSQIISKSSPVMYAQCWDTFDMKNASIQFASAEVALLRTAGIQMANYYNIPVRSSGLQTDSHSIDVQNGWEKMLTGLFGLLADIDLFLGIGSLGTCMTISKEQMIIDNELFNLINRLKSGITVSDELISTDIINQIGPKGSYIDSQHTLSLLRSGEYWSPEITMRKSYDSWVKGGKKEIMQIAREKAESILKTHQIIPLDKEKEKEIYKIIKLSENQINESDNITE